MALDQSNYLFWAFDMVASFHPNAIIIPNPPSPSLFMIPHLDAAPTSLDVGFLLTLPPSVATRNLIVITRHRPTTTDERIMLVAHRHPSHTHSHSHSHSHSPHAVPLPTPPPSSSGTIRPPAPPTLPLPPAPPFKRRTSSLRDPLPNATPPVGDDGDDEDDYELSSKRSKVKGRDGDE